MSDPGSPKIERAKIIIDALQVVATLSIAIVGYVFTSNNEEQQKRDRTAMAAVQLMSERERSETDFRRNMFDPLIDKLLSRGLSVGDRFAVLKIFQHNFHDLFNGRALFDVLREDAEREFMHNRDSLKDFLKKLTSLARDIRERQEQLIGGSAVRLSMRSGEDTVLSHVFPEDKHEHSHDEHKNEQTKDHDIEIKMLTIDSNSAKVFFTLDAANISRTFTLTYYDAPFTDNILLPDGHRLALTLVEIDSTLEAHLDLIHFPANFVTTGYRPSVDRVNEMLQESKK